jgi:hypothetical protein
MGAPLRAERGERNVDLVDPALVGQPREADPTLRDAAWSGRMRTHTFVLILESPREVTSELEDALFEAGCDDAAFGQRAGALYLEFDREAPDFLDAVLSAIRDAQTVPDVRVARIEPDEFVTATEIGRRVGRTRESVRLLVEGQRGPGAFPVPVSGTRRRTRLWRWSEVAEWLDQHGIAPARQEEARLIAALNGALDLVRNSDVPTREAILGALRKAS